MQAASQGIHVARIPSHGTGNAMSCAEHALYLTLALLRNQNEMAKSIQVMSIPLVVDTTKSVWGCLSKIKHFKHP